MRTAFFVDGYNLFYGLLGNSPFKWLDLPSLLASITHEIEPQSETAEINYFTAPVQPSLATRGHQSKHAQDTYIRALKASGVNVFMGRHRLDHRKAPRFISRAVPASRTDQVDIWNLEEKETDVRIGIGMYRLAAKQHCRGGKQVDQIVLVSGDTDMTPALEALREDFPALKVGIILPHRKGLEDRVAGSLKKNADWMRRSISEAELAACQFPDRVPTKKKPAIKPDYW